jgi:hypothetical protein
VWIPPKRHVDIFTGRIYDGEQEIDMYRSLKQTPVLAVEGSILPLDKVAVPANGCPNPSAYEVLVVVGADGKFELLENSRDDVKSETTKDEIRTTTINYDQAAGKLTFVGGAKEWSVRFISTSIKPTSIKVVVNGAAVKSAKVSTIITDHVPSTIVTIPASSKASDEVSIDIGSNLQLDVLDHTRAIHDFVLDFQLEFATKDRIWEIIQAGQSLSTKVARLLSLNLEEPVIGPILELLLADGR